ncbi:MAG: hypothetical protein AB1742_01370 [bacterium]
MLDIQKIQEIPPFYHGSTETRKIYSAPAAHITPFSPRLRVSMIITQSFHPLFHLNYFSVLPWFRGYIVFCFFSALPCFRGQSFFYFSALPCFRGYFVVLPCFRVSVVNHSFIFPRFRGCM